METIKFLDYTICMANGAIVVRDKHGVSVVPAGCEFLQDVEKVVDRAKKAAVILFMLARPDIFDRALFGRLTGGDGAYHEWFILKRVVQEEGLEMPAELEDPIANFDFLIGFKGQPLHYRQSA